MAWMQTAVVLTMVAISEPPSAGRSSCSDLIVPWSKRSAPVESVWRFTGCVDEDRWWSDEQKRWVRFSDVKRYCSERQCQPVFLEVLDANRILVCQNYSFAHHSPGGCILWAEVEVSWTRDGVSFGAMKLHAKSYRGSKMEKLLAPLP